MKLWNRFKAWIYGVVLAIGTAIGIIHPVESQTATQDTLSWTMPTQNTDNTALPLASIAKTTVVWGTAPGGPYPNTQDVAAPATTAVLSRPGDGVGTRCYKVAVTTTPAAGSLQGLWSAEGCKTVKAPPKEPTNFTAQ